MRRRPHRHLVDVTAQLGEAITQQLDFAREAASLKRLRANLDGMPVRVPEVVDAHCGPDVLVIKYVDGLRPRAGRPRCGRCGRSTR